VSLTLTAIAGIPKPSAGRGFVSSHKQWKVRHIGWDLSSWVLFSACDLFYGIGDAEVKLRQGDHSIIAGLTQNFAKVLILLTSSKMLQIH